MPAPSEVLQHVPLPGRYLGSLAAASGHGPFYVHASYTVHAVDLDGRLNWSSRVAARRGQIRVAGDGGIWLADDESVLEETRPDGSAGRRVRPPHQDDERIESFLVLADGFLVAWTTKPYRGGARVERLDHQGDRIWSTDLPPVRLAFEGIRQRGISTGWRAEPMPPWEPVAFSPIGLLVSGDRVLATYSEWASGLGVSFCFDLPTGELAWLTPPRPGDAPSVAGPGEFLIGAYGYSAFETRLYDRDGAVAVEWPSHGGLLVSGSHIADREIRMVEWANSTSDTFRVRVLHGDGTMTDGPGLPDWHTVGPVLSTDGRAAMWRDGRLQVIGPDLSVGTLCHDDGWTGHRNMLLLDGGRLAFVLRREGVAGSDRLVLAHTDLGALDDGVWPCAEGSLRANPVIDGTAPPKRTTPL